MSLPTTANHSVNTFETARRAAQRAGSEHFEAGFRRMEKRLGFEVREIDLKSLNRVHRDGSEYLIAPCQGRDATVIAYTTPKSKQGLLHFIQDQAGAAIAIGEQLADSLLAETEKIIRFKGLSNPLVGLGNTLVTRIRFGNTFNPFSTMGFGVELSSEPFGHSVSAQARVYLAIHNPLI